MARVAIARPRVIVVPELQTLDAPPEGFERHFRQSPLTNPWEPLFSKRADGVVAIGLRAAEAHANSRGFVHGGLISTLADNAMGLSCGQALEGGPSLVTVSLAVDFLGSAARRPMGAGHAQGQPGGLDPLFRRSDRHCRRRALRQGARRVPGGET
jgi:acyl-coenzyme A thioesterase PaaI-like protein